MSGGDILSIGEAMVELSCTGELQQANNFGCSYGGDALNMAIAAARLGSRVSFLTRHGQDAFADGLQQMLLREGVQSLPTPPSPRQTGLYFVAVDAQGERRFAYYRQNSAASQLSVEDIHPDVIESCKVVFASGITLAISDSSRQAALKAFKIARKAGITTAFDPNYRGALWPTVAQAVEAFEEILPWVDVFLPSFPQDTVSLQNFEQPEQLVSFFLEKEIPIVIAKAGGEGCYLGFKQEIRHYPALPVPVLDTSGAGDAFNGGFLHGLAQNDNLDCCVQLGLAVASLKITQPGTARAMPYRETVYKQLSRF
jgi:2-dehydro-3-deoxygluconokinase